MAASAAAGFPQAPMKPSRPAITYGADAAWGGGKGGLSTSAAEASLNRLKLGETLATAMTSFGSPWLVAYQGDRSYWMYRTDGGHAWFVLGVHNRAVDSVQVSLYAHDTSTLRDQTGVQLGGQASQVAGGTRERGDIAVDVAVIRATAGAHHFFYGIDRKARIDRIGRALTNDDLAAYARWYEFDGQGPDRPLPVGAYGGTPSGAQLYISRVQEPYLPCSGNTWRITSKVQTTYAGVPIAALSLQCGNTSLRRPYYLATSSALPMAFSADFHASDLLHAQRQSPRKEVSPAGTTGQIWSTTPNGTRMQGLFLDFSFAYIDDPNNPLSNVTVNQVPLNEVPPAGSPAKGKVVPLQGSLMCSFSSGGGKCNGTQPNNGEQCFQFSATFGAFNVTSGTVCFGVVNDPFNFPSLPALLGATGCSGGPVNAISGNLWYNNQDFQLSGPFGMSFAHRYDSTFATTQGDLGLGWRHTYGANLDLSYLSAGIVTFYDSDCNKVYLQTFGAGTSSYDQYSGDTLYTLNGSYKLVTWDNRTFIFNSAGKVISITDRIGNTQTINRNSNNEITSISDTLGRTLTFTYDTSYRIKTITSTPSAVSLTFTYDSNGTGTCYTGDLCSVEESDGSVWNYEYYSGSNLLEYVIDPLGHVEEYNTYEKLALSTTDDHYRLVTQSIDGGVNTYTYQYFLNGTNGTTMVTDNASLQHRTTYTWDENLQQVTGVSGYLCFCRGDSLMYSYDTFGRPLSVSEGGSPTPTVTAQYGRDKVFVSPDGKTTYSAIAYPSITQLHQLGIYTSSGFQTKTTQLAYYALETPQQDLPQTVTEPSVDTPGQSIVTTYTFSNQGLPTNIARAGYVNGTQTTYSVSATYDSNGRIQTFVGPRTDVTQQTTFTYYPNSQSDLALRGQLESIEDALGHTTTFASAPSPYNTYSLYGGTRSATDPNGVVTDFDYDLRGRLQKLTLKGVTGDPSDLITTLAYDTVGHLLSTTRPLGNSLANSYDSANRPIALTIGDASGNQREQFSMSYNTVSQLMSQSAQSCSTPATTCTTWQTAMTQSFSYATVGTLSSISNPAGGLTSFAFDPYGNSTGFTAGSGSYQYTTTNGFDPSHLLSSTQLSGFTSSLYTHDLQGNPTRVTTPSTASSNTFFDDFGCLRKEVSTYTGTTMQSCDRAGNVTSRTDANGATTTTSYDALNRPLTQTSVRSGVNTETVTRTYDNGTAGQFGIGRLASMTDPAGSTTYKYERRGMLASVAKTMQGIQYATTYLYNGNGDRTQSQLSVNAGTPFTLTYTYDYADRPSTVASGSTTYVSQALYEPMGPRSQLSYGNGTIQTTTYDQGYRPTEAKVVNGSTTLSDLSYTVNSAGYVTQVTDKLSAGYNESFTYGGKATNMLTQATTGASLWGNATYSDTFSQNLQTAAFPGRNLTYGYDRTYQLQSINQAGSGTQAITHDAVGNEIGVGSASYTYSSRELLSSGDGITYTYDGAGRRVEAQSTAGTRTSLYDPDMHLQAESSLTSGAVAYNYVWFGGTPVAQMDVGGSTHWTATDQRGAPFMQTNSSGNVYWQADYEPFGAVYDERTSDVHQPLRLPGQEAEEFSTTEGPNGASGRYYNGFRWYRPQFGRYTQPDPLQFLGSTYNLYAYANNNPLSYVDPVGVSCSPWSGLPPWFGPALLIGAAAALAFTGIGGAVELGIDLSSIDAAADIEEFDGLFQLLADSESAEVESAYADLAADGEMDLGEAAADSLDGTAAEAVNEGAADSLASVAEGLDATASDGQLPVAEGAVNSGAPPLSEGTATEEQAFDINFQTEHAAPHFEGSDLSQADIEAEIEGRLGDQFGGGTPTTVQGPFMGRVDFQGTIIEYRGFGLPYNAINIGTYYPIWP
jgi:RHS repeat-associated protein